MRNDKQMRKEKDEEMRNEKEGNEIEAEIICVNL